MFEQTFTATQKTKRERAIAFALIAQLVLVMGIGLLPLLGVEPLGPIRQLVALPPLQLGPDIPEPPKVKTIRSAVSSTRTFSAPIPRQPHLTLSSLVSLAPPGDPIPLMAGGSGPAGIPVGMPFGELQPAPPERPTPVIKPKAPVHLTSTIAQSQLIYSPKPGYPQLAVVSRSEGTVKLQAIISRDGKIENLHLVSGPALLVHAAMEAVRTWRYKPLLLNGEPVEVITEIDVIFTLSH